MADATPLAAAHPVETWAALGVLGAGLVALVGVLYNRINKDLDSLWADIEAHRKESAEQCEKVKKDIADVNSRLATGQEQMAQFATHNGFINNELSDLEASHDRLRDDFIELKTQHSMCFEDYKKGKDK